MADRMLDPVTADQLVDHLRNKRRLLITGLPGTGKTTLLRALALEAISSEQSLVLLQPFDEVQAHPAFPHGVTITGPVIPLLLQTVALLRPDYVLINDMSWDADQLQALTAERSAGVVSTLVMRSPEDVLSYVGWTTQRLSGDLRLSSAELRAIVSRAWDLIVHCAWVTDQDGQRRRQVTLVGTMQPDGSIVPWESFATAPVG
ncbi:hypothetical protein TPY_2174 [Sulfobacillus acidophilus TPY]|nr:hypothetical protein TPY_2174 [Sulfobacillus acidophilus TPY]